MADEWALILQQAPTEEQPELTQHFLNQRWKQIITHQQLKDCFKLDSQQQLTLTPPEDQPPIITLTFIATLLSVYVQINYTGPTQFESQPRSILQPPSTTELLEEEEELNAISLDLLSLAGEPTYHLAKSATFLLMAIQLIDHQLSSSNTSSSHHTFIWWKFRAEILRRHLFDQPIPLSDQLLNQIQQLSNHLSENHHHDLLPMLTLERGLAEHYTGNEKAANLLFRKAVSQAKLEYQLTGIPGKRTKFQEKDFSQLVVLAQSRTINADDQAVPAAAAQLMPPTTQDSMPVTLTLNDDTLMEKTHFTQSADSDLKIDPSNQPSLYPLDQALLLALSLSIKNTSPAHGLTNAQMAPFVERVLENPNNWSIHSMALLIRCRLEAHRTRTVERGLLQLQALVDQLSKDAENDPVDKSAALERVRWTWSLALPSRWELEKELAQKFSGLGLTRSALEIFERLEMWEHVVQCHLNLDSKKIGVELVRDLIEGKKVESSLKMTRYRSARDPKRLGKLWCLLAELESEPKHWETAWQVSQQTSSRAMRSLGGHYFMKGDYAEAKKHLIQGLTINPLFNKTWFIYGCAAMRTDDWDEAERAFRRCVALDDEDAEAWNNLATVHLKKATLEDPLPSNDDQAEAGRGDTDAEELSPEDGEEKEEGRPGGKFSRPMAAFYALQQAVKLSYDSWRMYTNYMIIAMSVGEYMEAVRAMGRVVEMRGEEGVDVDVLAKLVKVVEQQRGAASGASSSKEQEGQARTQGRLFERLTDVMDRVVLRKAPTNPVIWELRSQLAEIEGDPEAALRFQMDAYRAGVSARAEMWLAATDQWVCATELLSRTVSKLLRLGPHLPPPADPSTTPSSPSQFANWKWQAKNLSANFLARSRASFEDHPAFIDLQDFSAAQFSTSSSSS